MAVTSPPAPTLAPAPSAVDRPGAALGGTAWLTGLPSAGKTTVAHATADVLRSGGRRVEILDAYEPPAAPELRLATTDRPVPASAAAVLDLLAERGLA